MQDDPPSFLPSYPLAVLAFDLSVPRTTKGKNNKSKFHLSEKCVDGFIFVTLGEQIFQLSIHF